MAISAARARLLLGTAVAGPVAALAGYWSYARYPSGEGRVQFAILFAVTAYFIVRTFLMRQVAVAVRREAVTGATTVIECTASVEIDQPAPVVWARVEDPSFALLDPRCEGAVRLPGTPSGVGEVQIFTYRVDGKLTVKGVEILEREPGKYVRSRAVFPEHGVVDSITDWAIKSIGAERSRFTVVHRDEVVLPKSGITRTSLNRIRAQRQAGWEETLQRLVDSFSGV